VEEIMLQEIFLAFKQIYPTGEETCRLCIPQLGYTFTLDDLQRVFDEIGKTVFGGDHFFEFQRMLLEIGAIGKVIPGTKSDSYIMGDFEYTFSRQLYLSDNDNICVHPLFSDTLQRRGKQKKPVYPHGKIDVGEKWNIKVTDKVSKKIFVSYRRDDSADIAGRIYDRLVKAFDKKSVFKDVDSIPPGFDFRDVLNDAVKNCDIFLVIIGNQWLGLKNTDGSRRIDDPGDFVRFEIETALGRKIPVVPILVQGATMPPANKLPAEIRELAYKQGLQVRSDPDFHKDMNRLIGKL
jgi:hypothetical protein